MQIVSVAQQVWNALTRDITGFGANLFANVSNVNGAIAAAAIIDFRAAVNDFRVMSVTTIPASAATLDIALYDGTTIFPMQTGGSAANTLGMFCWSSNGVGTAVRNNEAVTAHVTMAGCRMAFTGT